MEKKFIEALIIATINQKIDWYPIKDSNNGYMAIIANKKVEAHEVNSGEKLITIDGGEIISLTNSEEVSRLLVFIVIYLSEKSDLEDAMKAIYKELTNNDLF
jgi:hypothetical protein